MATLTQETETEGELFGFEQNYPPYVRARIHRELLRLVRDNSERGVVILNYRDLIVKYLKAGYKLNAFQDLAYVNSKSGKTGEWVIQGYELQRDRYSARLSKTQYQFAQYLIEQNLV